MVRVDIWHCMREFSKNQAREAYLKCEEKNIQEYPRAKSIERILETLEGVEFQGLSNVMNKLMIEQLTPHGILHCQSLGDFKICNFAHF